MNKDKIQLYFEYLRTILLTIIGVAVILFFMLLHLNKQVYENQLKVSSNDVEMEYALVGVLIDKNKYLEEKNPKDYRINLKLGVLYEIYRDAKNAEASYKLACAKAPFNEYKPYYKLADFYFKNNRYEEAQKTIEDIPEKPIKILIRYKADIFNKLGDVYYNMGDYPQAIIRYQKALSYYQIIKAKPEIKNLTNSIASAYVYLADAFVDNMNIDEAISSLNYANSLVKAPILKYKLALLLIKKDPMKANAYFEEVYKKEPSLINYEVYYAFLNDLANKEEAVGKFPEADLYRFRAKKFKEFYQENILSIDDIIIESVDGDMTFNPWLKKYTINFELQLKNVSDHNLKSLFLNVVFKNNDDIFSEYTTQIVNKRSFLKPDKTSPVIYIKTRKKVGFNEAMLKNITAEIYVSKLENSYKLYLKSVDIKLVKSSKKHSWKAKLERFFQKFSFHRPKVKVFE